MNAPPAKSPYWFPPKRWGLGWGLPCRWQGWLVLIGYVALVAAAAVLLRPHRDPLPFTILLTLLTLVFVGITWLKGDPAGRHWNGPRPGGPRS